MAAPSSLLGWLSAFDPADLMPAWIWPLSQESMPVWISVLVVLATMFVRSFVLQRASEDQHKSDHEKRDHLLRVMAAVVEYVDAKEAEHEKAPPKAASAARIVEDGTPGGEHAREDFGPEGMPEATWLMQLVWDPVHGVPTTAYGIAEGDEKLVRVRELLKTMARTELRKAVHMTKAASLIAKGSGSVPDDVDTVMSYWSGEKLRSIVDFQKDELVKHLGPEYGDTQLLRGAEVYLRKLQAAQGKHMGKLFGFIKPHIPTLMFASVLLVLQAIFQSVFHEIGYWMTPVEMAASGDFTGMRRRLFQIFAGHLLFDVINTVREAYVDRATAELHSSVKQGVLGCLLQQDYEYFDRTPPGVLQERLNQDADQLGNNIIEFPQEILDCLVKVIVALIVVYSQVPRDIFVIAVAPLGPICALQYFIIKFWNRMDERMRKLNESTAASTSETLREIKTVRQFAMERKEARKFSFNSSRCQLLKERVFTSHRLVGLFFGLSIYGGLVLTMYTGAFRVYRQEMTFSALTTMTFKLNFNVVHTLRHLIEQLPRMNRLMQPLARISELLESSPKIEPVGDDASGLTPAKFRGLIQFVDVHFAYPKDPRKPVLKGLSFTVEPGQKVALIGATGCGKSSTMSLLQRLYDPQKGQILIDGKPLKDYNLRHLRSRIVIVDQFTVLFANSVRDNIIYGLQDVSDEDIEQACKDAACWDFLQEKPDKLMTMVATGGSNFSGGQRQRIAIARAIVRRPDVILLDEATASLDTENERLVQQALDKLARKGSALVIAHRLTTIKDSDKIVVVDHGVKVEEGSHDALLADLPPSGDDAKVPPAPPPPLSNERAASESGGASSPKSPSRQPFAKQSSMEPNPGGAPAPPRPLSLKRGSTFHGVKVEAAGKGHVTYKKLWDVSNSTQEKMTVFQMQQKIDKMESELGGLKGRVAAFHAETEALRRPMMPGKVRGHAPQSALPPPSLSRARSPQAEDDLAAAPMPEACAASVAQMMAGGPALSRAASATGR